MRTSGSHLHTHCLLRVPIRFNQIHGEVISESPDHKEVMEAIAVGQKKCWQRVNGLIQHNLCLVSFLGSMD